jgi:hypothetical protein
MLLLKDNTLGIAASYFVTAPKELAFKKQAELDEPAKSKAEKKERMSP